MTHSATVRNRNKQPLQSGIHFKKSIKILNVKGKLGSGGRKDCSYANTPPRLSIHMYTHCTHTQAHTRSEEDRLLDSVSVSQPAFLIVCTKLRA